MLLLIPLWFSEILIIFKIVFFATAAAAHLIGILRIWVDCASVWRVWQAVGGLWAALIVRVPLRL